MVAGLIALAGRKGPGWPLWAWLAWTLVLLSLALLLGLFGLTIVGGGIALRRDSLEARGIPYPPRGRREWLPGPSVQLVRRFARRIASGLPGRAGRLDLRPGELVEVKRLEEILQT